MGNFMFFLPIDRTRYSGSCLNLTKDLNFNMPTSLSPLFLHLLTARAAWSFRLCSALAINFFSSLRVTLTENVFHPPRIFASLFNPIWVPKKYPQVNKFLLIFVHAHALDPTSSTSDTWIIPIVDWICFGWVLNIWQFYSPNCLKFYFLLYCVHFYTTRKKDLLVNYKIHPLTLKPSLYLLLMSSCPSLSLWNVSAITNYLWHLSNTWIIASIGAFPLFVTIFQGTSSEIFSNWVATAYLCHKHYSGHYLVYLPGDEY